MDFFQGLLRATPSSECLAKLVLGKLLVGLLCPLTGLVECLAPRLLGGIVGRIVRLLAKLVHIGEQFALLFAELLELAFHLGALFRRVRFGERVFKRLNLLIEIALALGDFFNLEERFHR